MTYTMEVWTGFIQPMLTEAWLVLMVAMTGFGITWEGSLGERLRRPERPLGMTIKVFLRWVN